MMPVAPAAAPISGATPPASRAPAWITGATTLMIVALISLALAGCGGSTYGDYGLSPASAQPATTISTATTITSQTVQPRSLHERVMAEQGRVPNASSVGLPATTTSTGQSQPVAASGDVLPETADTTAVVLAYGQTPLRGVWSGTAERLASFLLTACPSPLFTASPSILAEYYVRYSAEADLRADILWAQMIHETGYGMYGGNVIPEQNNYAGIGSTGSGEPGAFFATAEAGVMAHVAHMVAYVYDASPVVWANSTTDPRFDCVNPRGAASVLADLNGRWAVPGTTYGEDIEEIVRAINR